MGTGSLVWSRSLPFFEGRAEVISGMVWEDGGEEGGWKRREDELCHRCLSSAAVCLTVGLRIRSIIGSREECAALTRQHPRESTITTRKRKVREKILVCLQIVLGRRRRKRDNRQYTPTCKHPLTPILRVSLPEPVRLARSCLPQPDGACE